MERPPNVGILAMEVYFPSTYVAQVRMQPLVLPLHPLATHPTVPRTDAKTSRHSVLRFLSPVQGLAFNIGIFSVRASSPTVHAVARSSLQQVVCFHLG